MSTKAAACRVAIIGGGISGCASARRLAQLCPTVKITLYEMGRGPGGRASTRKTRSLPNVYINHGTPYADIRSNTGRSIIASLSSSSLHAVAPFTGVRGSLDASTGQFTSLNSSEEKSTPPVVEYITGANGEMSQIATSLLTGFPSIKTQYKTMIRGLSRREVTLSAFSNGADDEDEGGIDNIWELRDKGKSIIGVADWLIVAGSGIAHPRWRNTFPGKPPLIAAAAAGKNSTTTEDPKLIETLDAIATQEVSPVLAVFFSCSGSTARQWLSFDFDVVNVVGSSILSRVMIQGLSSSSLASADEADEVSVVLHSTEEFAIKNSGVYGASSSAARIGDAKTDSSREDSIITEMIQALEEIPGIIAAAAATSTTTVAVEDTTHNKEASQQQYDYGPVLQRWGAAFPKGEPLSEELAFLPKSKVVFCGDYVASSEQPRMGSFESALLSGTAAGENIANFLLQKGKGVIED